MNSRFLLLYLVSLTSCSQPKLPVDTITLAPDSLPTIDPAIVQAYDKFIADNCYDMADGSKAFMGPNELIAVAPTCDDAFLEWRKLPAPRFRALSKI